MEKVLLIGASPNPDRYAYKAFKLLTAHGHQVVLLSAKKDEIDGVKFINEFPQNENFDTVTLYINPQIQKQYYNDFIKLKPKRIIFNPGTENEELYHLLDENNIIYMEACTLVLLRTGQY
jgi:hypothetical protein